MNIHLCGNEGDVKIGAALVPKRERGPDLIRPQTSPKIGAAIPAKNYDFG
jgi:hypothetical protein